MSRLSFSRLAKVGLSSLALALSTPAAHADGGWVVKKEQGGIQVSQRQTGSAHEVTRGQMSVAASVAAVAALLDDIAACPRWVHDCIEARRVEMPDLAHRLDYTVIQLPLLLQDRDMYIWSETRYDPATQTLSVALTGKENYDKGQAGRTRILGLKGSWVVKQITPQQTQIDYEIYLDPRVTLGDAANANLVTSVFQTLRKMRAVVKEDKYHNAQFDDAFLKATAP